MQINPMNPLLKILLYVVVVLAVGVVLSPPIYWLCQFLISHGWLSLLEGFPFHRYFSRTLQVTGLILLFPLAWWLQIRSMAQIGLIPNPRRWSDAGLAFLCGLVPLLILAGVYLAMDWYALRSEPGWGKLPRVVLTAGVVSVLEEFFFRGILLGLAVQSLGRLPGAALSALVFACLHFLRPAKLPSGPDVTWLSGWEQLLMIFHGAPPWPLVGYGFFTLLLAGGILAWITLRTRSLWGAIGLHAGWILGQQGFLALARWRVRPEDALLPWLGPNVVSGAVPTGLVPALVLTLTGGILWWCWRKR